MAHQPQAFVKAALLPAHLQSLARYLLTIPNIMGYARLALVLGCPLVHHLGISWLPPVMYFVNLCIIDNLDGIAARRFGQCTQFGRILDIATDVVTETVFTGLIAVASFESPHLPECFTGYGLLVALCLYRWFDTVGCFVCIALTFGGGTCWKDLRYPCPVTRWYYETNVGGYSMYIGYHTFLAAFYMMAQGRHAHVGEVLGSICLPFYLLRQWSGLVSTRELLKMLWLMDVDRVSIKHG
jgi:CDP-diacylglycerol--inositol 3-phosphatidyltransferase